MAVYPVEHGVVPTCIKEEKLMLKAEQMWQCQMTNCGYIYNPNRGDKKGKIPPDTPFEDLPDDWKCPCCGSSKSMFKPLNGPGSVMVPAVKCSR